ncbi:hypothetical protein [uncultured Paracoccus sp.]|uniref:hypothetical protein n=1 Tax=uncultured Paracoccus sp. TaxID=189685 RepID=UPI00262C3EC8|nr:hypothetical protein [uncultured Paracoccus sp.]
MDHVEGGAAFGMTVGLRPVALHDQACAVLFQRAQRVPRGNALTEVHVAEPRARRLIAPRITAPSCPGSANHVSHIAPGAGFFSGRLTAAQEGACARPEGEWPATLRAARQRPDYHEHEGIKVDLSADGEPITGMRTFEVAFRIFRLPTQLSQDCVSDLLFHSVLPLAWR